MDKILSNNFNKEIVTYSVEHDLGYVALYCKIIRKCIELGKRVLLFSLEQPENYILKRIGLTDTTNLLVKDKLLSSVDEISNSIDGFKPDIVIIDYFFLLTKKTKSEDFYVLSRIAKQAAIPFIVVFHRSGVKNKGVDFTNISLDEYSEINKSTIPIINESDRFIVFYQRGPKEYMLKELKNVYGETKEFDIRELLN